jgi:serine protease Do
MNFKSRILTASTALALVAGGWGLSHVEWSGMAHAKPEDNPAAAAVPRVAAGIPDFTALVRSQGQAVVNIQIEREGEQGVPGGPQGPQGVPPNQFGPLPFPFEPPVPGRPNQAPRQAQGSGFIVSPDGFVITNAHVVGGGGDITVKLTDKREYKAKLIGADTRTDVAVLKIDASDLPHVKLGDPEKVQVGEWVAAIGSPFGFENTISAGILSAKGRSLPSETYVPYLQTDVAVNPGNSGGPLFNLNGEVIGVNSQIYSRTGGYMGLSFAIPIDIAMDVADQLRETGKVTRGRLGVQIQGLTQDLARSFGLKQPSGALVSSVEKDSPAQRAGVETGDVILQFNGAKVEDSKDLPVLVARTKPGTDAKLTVWRNGKEQTIDIKVGELQPERVAAADTPQAAPAGKLGLAVQELPLQRKQELDVKGGVVVGSVQGAAARAGIQPGDVVIAVNGEQVESVQQFTGLVDKASSGRPLALLIQRGDARIYVPVTVS